MATQIQLRRGTAAQWTAADPVLAEGEIGLELDTGKRKIGDGTQAWSALAYDLTQTVADARYAGADTIPAAGMRITNAAPDTLANWRKAVANVRTGAADAKLLCAGDSNTWGLYTGGVPTNAYPTRLAALLNSYYAPAKNGLFIPETTNNGGELDARITRGFWGLSNYGFAGKAALSISGGSPLTLNPGVSFDRLDVYYVRNTDLGTITVSINGEAGVAQSTVGAAFTIGKTTFSASTVGTHSVTITPSGGFVALIGFDVWDSTSRRIRVGNAGVSGTTSFDWASTTNAGTALALTAYDADLTLIMLGVNDTNADAAVADYTTRMQTVITRAKATGDVVLLSPMLVADATRAARQVEYREALIQLATDNGCALIDIQARLGTDTEADAIGIKFDNNHPNALGAVDIAGAIFAALSRI